MENLAALLPAAFALHPNFPNPFNPSTTIAYQVPQDGPVELTVYNIVGQPLVQLVRDWRQAGTYRIAWDGRDAVGQAVGSGVYFYRLRAAGQTASRRMHLLK